MNTLVIGSFGLLGSYLMKDVRLEHRTGPSRTEFDLDSKMKWNRVDLAFLCAGTKGFAENEGNRESFRSDVDGNIRLARHLLKHGAFVVFVSTDAVEWALHTAYARNRFMVELAIGNEPNVAIFRPSKFTQETVADVAKACANVGLKRIEGLTRWP